MTVALQSMFIPVHDPDAALGFYRDALGLEVRLDVSNEGFRWVTVGAPGQDVGIVLFQPHGGRSQAEGDALLALVTQGSLQAAIFRSDDLDTTFEKVRASGAEVLQEPTSQPWARAIAPSATRPATWSVSPRPDRSRATPGSTPRPSGRQNGDPMSTASTINPKPRPRSAPVSHDLIRVVGGARTTSRTSVSRYPSVG